MKWVCVVLAALVGASCGSVAELDQVEHLRNDMKNLMNAISEVKLHQSLDVISMKNQVAQVREEMNRRVEEEHRKLEHVKRVARAALKALQRNVTLLMSERNATVELKKQEACAKDNEVQGIFARTKELTMQSVKDHRMLEQHSATLTQLQNEMQLLRFKKQLNNTDTNVATASPPVASRSRTPLRHHGRRAVNHRIAQLKRAQRRAVAVQANLQHQLKEARQRLDKCAKQSDWSILASRVDMLEVENNGKQFKAMSDWKAAARRVDELELESKLQKEQLANVTREVSDSDKLHSSILELLENVESLESKVDKTLPEFRREISKLDINMAQVNSQISYSREDTENLRQSVKAIAFSVSNSIDKDDSDRAVLRRLNLSVSALEQLSKQHSYRLYDHILKTEANRTDDGPYDPFVALPELMGEVKDLQPAHREYEELVAHLPRDCSAVFGPPARYLVAPGSAPLDTWCSSGTTLLQRRFDGSVEFNLKFSGYVRSFGSPTGEYWIGLENMHLLTADNCSSMRIDMTDIYGAGWYASYDRFYVGPADTGYQLFVGGFTGNASDAFEYQNRMEFSAIDRDRDISNTHCAGNYEGGWWFSHCQHVNINGRYTLGLTWFDSARNEWIAVATSEMTLSRRADCVAATATATAAATVAATAATPN